LPFFADSTADAAHLLLSVIAASLVTAITIVYSISAVAFVVQRGGRDVFAQP
jgi:uncharacterized membrane protein